MMVDNVSAFNGRRAARGTQLWQSQMFIQNSKRTSALGNLLISDEGADTMGIVHQNRSAEEGYYNPPEKYTSDDYHVEKNIFRHLSPEGQLGIAGRFNLASPGFWDNNRIQGIQEWWDKNISWWGPFEDSARINFDNWKLRTGHDTNSTAEVVARNG